MMNESDYISIEKYLAEELSTKEKVAFEQRLKNEHLLVEELTLRKSLHTFGQNRVKINQSFDWIEGIDQQYRNQKKKVRIRHFITRIAAAAAIVLLVGGGIYFFTTNNISTQHRPLSNMLGNNTTLTDAIRAYNDHNYEQALPLIEEAVRKNENPDLIVAKGVAQLELEQFRQATQTFNDLLENEGLYYNEANWYLGLIEFRQQNEEQAIVFWEKIAADSPYKERSKQLLK